MNSVALWIAKAIPALGNLKDVMLDARASLVSARAQLPDLASVFDARIADLDAKIAALDQAADSTSLAELAVTVGKELLALKEGLKPKFHPGDVTGG